MTRQEVADLVISLVTGPIKGTELAAKVATELLECNASDDVIRQIPAIFEELVKEEKIIEIEYVLREHDYRIKSIYFPVGTLISYKRRLISA